MKCPSLLDRHCYLHSKSWVVTNSSKTRHFDRFCLVILMMRKPTTLSCYLVNCLVNDSSKTRRKLVIVTTYLVINSSLSRHILVICLSDTCQLMTSFVSSKWWCANQQPNTRRILVIVKSYSNTRQGLVRRSIFIDQFCIVQTLSHDKLLTNFWRIL